MKTNVINWYETILRNMSGKYFEMDLSTHTILFNYIWKVNLYVLTSSHLIQKIACFQKVRTLSVTDSIT